MLDEFLEGAFLDMPKPNAIKIEFGRKAKRRFGSIKMKDGVSLITINGLFRKLSTPEEIIRATLAHELCHYAHGFSSKNPKKYRTPHQGGVIRKEMEARGLGDLYLFEKKWTKANWRRIVEQNFCSRKQRRVVRRSRRSKKVSLVRLLHAWWS